MKKARTGFSIILLLVAGGLLTSGGKKEMNIPAPVQPAPLTISAPKSAITGECITVLFTSESDITEASVSLINPSGKIVATVHPFVIQNNSNKKTQIALLGLSTTLERGSYSIETTIVNAKESITSTFPIILETGSFSSEDIFLNAINKAIKKDTSKERILQIKRLNEIFFAQNKDAPRFSGPFKKPVETKRITSRFGDRRTYHYQDGTKETNLHYGIDFGVCSGTPVFASGDGRVVMAEERISTGWSIVIEHLPGVYSIYYHMEQLLAGVGENVRLGTLIGRTGNSGLSTGPHLHWEFRVNGEAVSPDFFIRSNIY